MTARLPSPVGLPLVSVITVTRDREESLLRCAESVAAQDYLGRIEHLIVVDDRHLGSHTVERLRLINHNVRVEAVRTSERLEEFQPFFSVSRIGYLRNQGIDLCRGQYIAYLDDDNTFHANHISSLVDLLEKDTTAAIAYSWRYLLAANGDPFVEPRYPWVPWSRLATDNQRLALHIHEELLRSGIRATGDNIQRDAVIASDGSHVFTVDTSEMLVRKEVHATQRWVTHFTWRQMTGDYSDDYAFVKRCHEAGMRFVCSEKPTLNYHLDGVSNRASSPPSAEKRSPLAERMRAGYEQLHGRGAWRPEIVRSLAADDGRTYRLFRTVQRHEYNRQHKQGSHAEKCVLCEEMLEGIVFLDRLLIVPDPVPFAQYHFLLRFLRSPAVADPRTLFESRHVTRADLAHREGLLDTDICSCLQLAQATGDLICVSLRGSGASIPEHSHAHAFRQGFSGSLTLPLLGPRAVRLRRVTNGVRLSLTTTPAFGTLLQGNPTCIAERLARTVDEFRVPVNFVAGHGGPFQETWMLAFWRQKECPSHSLFWDDETGPWRFGFSEMLGLFEFKSRRQLQELTPSVLEEAMREVTISHPELQAQIEESLLC